MICIQWAAAALLDSNALECTPPGPMPPGCLPFQPRSDWAPSDAQSETRDVGTVPIRGPLLHG